MIKTSDIYTDQMRREVEIPILPKRIVSLVPSQTELLFDLGLEDEVVGITKFCMHPESWFRSKTRIGGTKNLTIGSIFALNPDLIIGNKEENEKVQIEQLAQMVPVWMSDVNDLNSALEMIEKVGAITGRRIKADSLRQVISEKFSRLKHDETLPSAAYFIWQNPMMVAGGDTFISSMLERAGFLNVFQHQKRYPVVNEIEVQQANPNFIFLSSEPFPFLEKHEIAFRQTFPNSIVKIVDGEMFSWYGSRLLYAPDYFSGLKNELTHALSA